jgi:polyhydroxyalkanoate synthesis regulator phasin
MGLSTVLIISLAAGVILVVGGGIMMYMANLVKSAYEIKVQINADVDERLSKMAEDLDKKSKWIKRDLMEEIDKIKTGLETQANRRFQEMSEPLAKQAEDIELLFRAERTEWVKAIDTDRQTIAGLDSRIRALRRDIKRLEEKLGMTPSMPDTPAAPADEANAAVIAAAVAAAATKAPPAPAAKAAPTGPVLVSSTLQDFNQKS